MKWFSYIAIALLCTLMYTGCVAIKGVEGSAENVRCELGTLVANMDASIKSVAAASGTAVDEIGFTEKQVAEDAMNAVITAKTAKAEKVTIRVTRVTESSSKLTIRIGKLGDAQRSIMVLEKIQENLPKKK